MPSTARLLALALALAVVATLCAPGSADRTSHACPAAGRAQMGVGVTCSVVRVPPGLCSACPLETAKVFPDGYFDCEDIFDKTPSKCRRALRQYVKHNPCDPLRARAVEEYYDLLAAGTTDTPEFRAASGLVDYLVYSLCESCCDCISVGSERDGKRRVPDVTRANCALHIAVDICTTHPKVARIVSTRRKKAVPGESEGTLTSICPQFRQWRRVSKPQYDELILEPKVEVPQNMQDFLKETYGAVRCKRASTWDACWQMETTLGRI